MSNEMIVIEKYKIDPNLWSQLENEIKQKVSDIQSGKELTPDDFVELKNLNKRVDEYATGYNRAVTDMGKRYKAMLTAKKSELGYDIIDEFIARKRNEQQLLKNNRMNSKIDTFNKLVLSALNEHPNVNSTPLRETVINNFIGRFPKVKSGAESSEIKNWTPIATVIKTTLDTVENILTEHKEIMFLPIYSMTMRSISTYLRTGDSDNISNISKLLESDKTILSDIALKQQLNTPSDLLNLVQQVLDSDDDDSEKIKDISTLIQAWNTKQ